MPEHTAQRRAGEDAQPAERAGERSTAERRMQKAAETQTEEKRGHLNNFMFSQFSQHSIAYNYSHFT